MWKKIRKIMNKEEKDIEMQEEKLHENDYCEGQQPSVENEPASEGDSATENEAEPNAEAELEKLREQVKDLEDKNLRMMAEFENYRRRTNKEKLDLIATAGERIFKDMLPLVDDFERAAEHGDLSEGGQLIYKKFQAFLEAQNVHAIATSTTTEDGETVPVDFNTDEHEAITTFAAGEDKKGKIIDCTQRGYKLGDKVIRFAKVVVGE